MRKIPGYRQISGTWGELWWDGEKVYEVEAFEAKVVPNREDVPQAGSNDIDSKITGVKGEGTFRIKHVFSRGAKALVQAWRDGKDPRAQLIGKLADPDAYGSERAVINNVWFNEATIMQFESGKLSREFPFGYTVSDIEFPDQIEVQEV